MPAAVVSVVALAKGDIDLAFLNGKVPALRDPSPCIASVATKKDLLSAEVHVR